MFAYLEEVEVDGTMHLLDVYRVCDDPLLELTQADMDWLKEECVSVEED